MWLMRAILPNMPLDICKSIIFLLTMCTATAATCGEAHLMTNCCSLDSIRSLNLQTKSAVKEIFADGDKLVKYWQFKGKHTGPFFGIPATGKDVDVSGVTIAKMKDGKIAEEQDFMDNLEFMQQLGLIPRQ